MRTWHIEAVVVGIVLVLVALLSGGGHLELIGAGAVLLSFCHAQVADRLAEREASREVASVECHRWATRYLVSKELLWCAYFVLHQSWSALAGVVLFVAYPLWRCAWRKRRPLAVVRPTTTTTLSEMVHSDVVRPIVERWGER